MSRGGAPEIGMGFGLFLGVISFIVGLLVGIHEPLWIQGCAVVGLCLFMNSYYVGSLELGALAYLPLTVFGIIGIIIGDISYIIQTDVQVWDTIGGWFTFSFDAFDVK